MQRKFNLGKEIGKCFIIKNAFYMGIKLELFGLISTGSRW